MRKTALIHEWLTSYAGSERVLEQLLVMHPAADLYAVADFLSDADRHFLHGKQPTTSFAARLPFARRLIRHYLPLLPIAIEQWDLSQYDVVISSNHAVAKGVLCGPDQLHVSYVHTPIRYAWEFQHQYLRESKLTWGLRSMLIRGILHYMRAWDYTSACRVDAFIANSHFIANRIRKCYGRTAEVIYPPVDVDGFGAKYEKSDYYFTASRLVPYKRVDLVIEAFRKMPHRKLIVVGDGPMYKQLKSNCPANVEMLGYQPHEKLKSLMQQARAFVFAAEEDFGIMPVEAQACATPVIAYGRGGSLETVVDGVTGCFFESQQADSIVAAVDHFADNLNSFDLAATRQHAEHFRPERFREQIANFIDEQWKRFSAQRRSAIPHPTVGNVTEESAPRQPVNIS